MEIDIYSDVICPWCYIGKRRLEQALESFAGDVPIRYRPFQLDPTPVAEPVLFLDNLAAKVGGPARAKQLTAGAIAAAAGAGIDFRYDRAVKANTFDAHRLIWFATSRGLAAETVEALYRAFFIDGVDVGSHAALAALAAGVGLDE